MRRLRTARAGTDLTDLRDRAFPQVLERPPRCWRHARANWANRHALQGISEGSASDRTSPRILTLQEWGRDRGQRSARQGRGVSIKYTKD